MNKKRTVIAAALITVGLVLNFAFTGHGFIAYTLYFAAALIVFFSLAGKRFKRIIAVLLAVGFAYFIVTEGFILSFAAGDTDENYDYIIVLGAAVHGDTPSLSLIERMEAARVYLAEHPDTTAILSGGQGDGENLSEAEAMYTWLTQKGIDGSRLLLEDRSTSTLENLKFSFDIISSRSGADAVSAAVVTSEYHIYRAKLIAASLGEEVGGVAANTTYFTVKLNYFIREAFGVTYQWIFG